MLISRFKPWMPGLLLCALIAICAGLLGEIEVLKTHGLSVLTLAIVIGMVVGNAGYKKFEPTLDQGVVLSKQNLLRFGIVLYGFRLTMQDIGNVGMAGVFSDVLVLCSTFLLALFVGIKLFGLHRNSVILIGAGSSICGAAAIMATDGVLEAEAGEVSVAVSTVVVFGSLAIFLYPVLYQLNVHWNLISGSATAFGVYAGSTIHEVAQVVAAGRGISPAVADVAVITKMVRVMMLAPFLLLLPVLLRKVLSSNPVAAAGRVAIPWFALLFIAAAGLNSMHLLPAQLTATLIQLDTILLAMAMAALGLTTHLSAVRAAGLKPLLLALILFVWLIIGGALINKLVFWL